LIIDRGFKMAGLYCILFTLKVLDTIIENS